MKRILISFGIILLLSSQVVAQTVTGTVTDAGSGKTLPGVNIVVKDTNVGTATDATGSYQLSVPSLKDTLVVSFIGYQTKEVPINGRTQINIAIQPQAIIGEEMVVVGYGKQEEVSVTSAVSQIEDAELKSKVTSNIQQSLQGKISGLTILNEGAAPGNEDIYMRIRGITTMSGSNSPLVIVDGVEQRLADINPNDIKSISVLKDAASTAIYGSRAASGVILVTTKRAEKSDLNVSINSYYAIQRSNQNPEHMGLENYMRLQQIAWKNSTGSIPEKYTDENIEKYVNATNRLKYPLPNVWYDVVLSPAPQYETSLSISGGNERIQSRLSIRYRNQQGIVANSSSKIGEVRLNTDFSVSPKLSFKTNINYRHTNTLNPLDVPGRDGVFVNLLQRSQWTVPQYSDGTYGISPEGNNPLMYAEKYGTSKRANNYILGSIKGELEILKNLTFTTQLSARFDETAAEDFKNSFVIRDYYNPEIVTKSEPINWLREMRNNTKEYAINALLNYSFSINDHDMKILGGYTQIKNESEGLNAYRQEFYDNQLRSINMGKYDATASNSGSEWGWGLRSYFGRVNYSYKDKYLVQVNGRYDGSSRFLGDNKYSFFPSFSAGWRVSEENFWPVSENIINELKLRVSWGQAGNQAVDLYSGLISYNNVTYSFNDVPARGFTQTQAANKNLKWETTTQTNIGLDAELFEGKISLSVNYYNKITDDILLNLPVPATLGLAAPPQNAGRVDNEGWEFGISAQNSFNDLFVNSNFNFSLNNNTIVDLAGTGPTIYGSRETRYIYKEGLPINAFWGYITDGYFQTEEEIENYPTRVQGTQPGDVKYVDRNGDGEITADDMVYLGNTFYKYNFGANLDFAYKGFGLNIFLQGAFGGKTRLGGALIEMGIWGGFTHENIAGNYWTPNNRDARFPRPLKFDLRNHSFSDRSLIDRSYLRLKNVRLSYNIPSSLLKETGINISRFEIYVSATNLLTFSELSEWGVDPETEVGGRAQGYPQTSVSTAGINIQF